MAKWTWLILLFIFTPLSVLAEEVPAEPEQQDPPAFPVACAPNDATDFAPQYVIVTYDITREGLPENVRVRESSDTCFNDVSVAAVRRWTFKPRMVDRRRQPQTDMETTFQFEFDAETALDNFDARPIKRVPPEFPDRCNSVADGEYIVVVQFDVSDQGLTENIQVIESGRSCFEKAAVRSVEKWKYLPKIVDGRPVARRDVVTSIKFIMGSGREEPEDLMRSSLVRKLNKAGRLIKSDPERALVLLDEIEKEYGDSFTKAETAAFHQIRGFARIGVNDAPGALDDLRIARNRPSSSDEREAIENAIEQLELYVARSGSIEAAGAASNETEAAAPEE